MATVWSCWTCTEDIRTVGSPRRARRRPSAPSIERIRPGLSIIKPDETPPGAAATLGGAAATGCIMTMGCGATACTGWGAAIMAGAGWLGAAMSPGAGWVGTAIIMVGAVGAAERTVGGGVAPIMTVGDEGWTRIGVEGGETTTGAWAGLLKTGLAWTGTIIVEGAEAATGCWPGGLISAGCEVTGGAGAWGEP